MEPDCHADRQRRRVCQQFARRADRLYVQVPDPLRDLLHSTPQPGGTPVTLTATPDTNSLFGGWGGDCGIPACAGKSCPITMGSIKDCSATFTYVKPARIAGSNPLKEYDSLQAAYDDPLTLDGAVILAREFTFLGGLILDKAKKVTIKGGFAPDYNAPVPATHCSKGA